MPTYSLRALALKKLERRITKISQLLSLKSARRLHRFYVSLHHTISSRRYLDRHPLTPIYKQHHYILHANARFPGNDAEHKQLFCVTTREFRQLIDIFGGDGVFQPRAFKPMAPAELQLAVLLNRMAHGHSVPTIARSFNLPGLSLSRLSC